MSERPRSIQWAQKNYHQQAPHFQEPTPWFTPDGCVSPHISCQAYGGLKEKDLPQGVPTAGVVIKGVKADGMMPRTNLKAVCQTMLGSDLDVVNECVTDLSTAMVPEFNSKGKLKGVHPNSNNISDGYVQGNYEIVLPLDEERVALEGVYYVKIAGHDVVAGNFSTAVEKHTVQVKDATFTQAMGEPLVYVLGGIAAMAAAGAFINPIIEKVWGRAAERVHHVEDGVRSAAEKGRAVGGSISGAFKSAKSKLHSKWDR